MSADVLTTLRARARATKAFSNEEVKSWAQDYHRYLQAKQLLLTARIARDSIRVVFEQGTGPDVQEAEAQRILNEIPRDRQVVFDAVWEQERQHLQAEIEEQQRAEGGRARIVDPNVIDQLLSERLYNEAMGIGTEEGTGWVPLAPEEDAWFQVDVAGLHAIPDADAYLVRKSSAQDQRQARLLILGATVAAVLTLLIWAVWPSGTATPLTQTEVTATANGSPLAPWPITTLVITATNGEAWTVPMSTTLAPSWPRQAERTPPIAFWRLPALQPLTICVPRSIMEHATQVQVISGGFVPDRRYRLHDRATTQANLILESCTGGDSPPWTGSLEVILPLPIHAVGDPVVLPNEATLTVQAIEVQGTGDDPHLPAQQARLTVQVQTSEPLDWPRYAPTLLLPSGQTVPVAETEATTTGTLLRYLIPLPQQPLAIRWTILPPGGIHGVQWNHTVDVPPSRMDVLRAAVEIDTIEAVQTSSEQLTLSLVLRNQTTQPFVLTPEDIVLTQGDQRLPIPDSAVLHHPLDSGRATTLELPLPVNLARGPILVTIGPYRTRLERR